MSNCSNCYNGCTEIVSDKCVKYTGIDVPVLGIQTGDSLSYVEQALITFLTSTLDGTGIKLDIDSNIICDVVGQYLPTCKDINVLDLSIALIKASCKLQEEIGLLGISISEIEAPYTTNCLTGVTSTSGTHNILQATIDALCTLQTNFNSLLLSLPITYVSIADIDTYIQNYLDSESSGSLVNSKMIPYVAVPYFGPISYFDATGAGIGNWDKIYLCNGNNATPDLRGRTLVGVTDGSMLGGIMSPVVDPTISGNPNYSMGTTAGTNQVVLDSTQIPSHTHSATAVSTVTPESHSHLTVASPGTATSLNANDPIDEGNSTGGNLGYSLRSASRATANVGKTSDVTIDVEVVVSNSSTGGGLAHANVQPSIGCYYIIYIP